MMLGTNLFIPDALIPEGLYSDNGPRVGLAFLRVGDLVLSHENQRVDPPKPSVIRRLVEEWSDDKVGAGTVNVVRTSQGLDYRVIDGRHRALAALARFGPDYELPFVITSDLSSPREAAVFLGANRDRVRTGLFDEYEKGVRAKESPYIEIEMTLRARELGVADKASSTRVGAVGALISVANTHGAGVLGDTVDVLIQAFGRTPETWESSLLRAVARLIAANETVLDWQRLVSILEAERPKVWLAIAREKAKAAGGSDSRSYPLTRALTERYNARLRTRRLRSIGGEHA